MPPPPKADTKFNEYEDDEYFDDTPPSVEPYSVLGLEKSASANEIKSAYRKAALRHHPDKVPADRKDEAHIKFQEIAFAYAVLSDPIRRNRYDTTGSVHESLSSAGDFSWADFYNAQFKDIVTEDSIKQFAKIYKASDEEKDDLLAAYTKFKGKWEKIYEVVMLSDPFEDEDRFREIIENAIKNGDVKSYKSYAGETTKAKKRRLDTVLQERKELAEMATKVGAEELLKSKSAGGGEATLQALILKNKAGQSTFLDNLEAKYATQNKISKGKNAKKWLSAKEPLEEDFLAARAQMEQRNGGRSKRRRI